MKNEEIKGIIKITKRLKTSIVFAKILTFATAGILLIDISAFVHQPYGLFLSLFLGGITAAVWNKLSAIKCFANQLLAKYTNLNRVSS